MHWLEVLGILPKGNHRALRFNEPAHWEVDGTPFASLFFRALSEWAPPGSVLYLEGSSSKRVARFLSTRQVSSPEQVAVGTIMPAPDKYHVAARTENLVSFADLIDEHRITVPVIHVVLYNQGRVILSWYDAFCGGAILVSSSIGESVVRHFAAATEMEYRWRTHAA
jgi:hypothetical protein